MSSKGSFRMRYIIYRGGNIAEKKIGDIGHFRRYGNKNKFFRSKNEKRVSVGNDVICQTIFQFYKEFYDWLE